MSEESPERQPEVQEVEVTCAWGGESLERQRLQMTAKGAGGCEQKPWNVLHRP